MTQAVGMQINTMTSPQWLPTGTGEENQIRREEKSKNNLFTEGSLLLFFTWEIQQDETFSRFCNIYLCNHQRRHIMLIHVCSMHQNFLGSCACKRSGKCKRSKKGSPFPQKTPLLKHLARNPTCDSVTWWHQHNCIIYTQLLVWP